MFNPGFNKTLNYFFCHYLGNVAEPEYFMGWSSNNYKKRNIVYIYLESLENTYTDEKIFPDLVPNINNYKKEGVSFENMNVPTGSGWTIAAMVASQCAMPLVTGTGGANSMDQLQKFLPSAKCLGDILRENGYKNYYYGGADLKFAGKGNFYRNHGFQNVNGLQELKNREEITGLSGWGVYDDDLFKIIQNDFDEIKKHENYALFLLNLDTHHPHGHVSSTCKNIKYGDGKIKILNAVHCTDSLVHNFVEKIREKDPSAIIVIASDHLAMPNDAKDILVEHDRKNLFIILNSELKNIKHDKKAVTYDIAPTILSLIGFDNNGLGWGRNLLRGESVLANFQSLNDFNSVVNSFKTFHQNMHGIFGSFRVLKKKDEFFELNGVKIKPPFAVKVNKNGLIDDVFFKNADISNLKFFINSMMHQVEGGYIFLDRCDNMKIDAKDSDYCYLVSKYEWEEDKAGVVTHDFFVNDSFEIKNWQGVTRIKNDLAQYFGYDIEFVDTPYKIYISSFPFGRGSSSIEWDNTSKVGSRGIQFYGYDEKSKNLELLEHKDFCNPDEHSHVGANLMDALNSKNEKYSYVMYVVMDSAWCDKDKYLKYAQNLDNNFGLEDIEFREAAVYIKTPEKEYLKKSKNGVVFVSQ